SVRANESTTSTATNRLEQMPDPASLNLDTFWEAEWEGNLLSAAITKVKRRVDPEKFQVFDLYVQKGLAPEKVAEIFGISIDQVYLTKHRMTDAIRDEVRRLE